MLSLSGATRPLMRRSAVGLRSTTARRFQSSSPSTEKASSAASASVDAAKQYASKAGQGLSRVTSAAAPAIVNAAKGLGNTMSKMGGRTGQLVDFLQRHTPFVVYYTRVGVELSKLVFKGQKMSPPSISTFQTYFQNLWKQLSNPSALLQRVQSIAPTPNSFLQRVRGLSTTQLVTGGVVLAECLGFFTVGEMIGRFKIIGYHGQAAAHH